MKNNLTKPFINSVDILFKTMFHCEIQGGEIQLLQNTPSRQDIMALIGLSGRIQGFISLSFSAKSLLTFVNQVLGMNCAVIDNEVKEITGELVNMIGGQAKAQFYRENETPLDLGLPHVITGEEYIQAYPQPMDWHEVQFTGLFGSFILGVSLKQNYLEIKP